MQFRRFSASLMLVVVFFAGTVASAQQGVDRFTTEGECVVAVKEGRAKWYQPSFFDHRLRPPSRPVATIRPLEERACAEMWIVGGWAWVSQPGVPQAGGSAPKFDFDGGGQPIRRSDCGNRVRKITYVPVPLPPSPPAPSPPPPVRQLKPEPPPAAPARGDVNININITVPPSPPRWEEPKPRAEPRVEKKRRKLPWIVGIGAGIGVGIGVAILGGDGYKNNTAVTGPGRL